MATSVWIYQGGAPQSSSLGYGASASADNSVFLAGAVYSFDGWDGHLPSGEYDFAVVKLDEDGEFLWAWLEGSEGSDFLTDAAAVADGGVVVTGVYNGTWNGETSSGETDFAAVKLDSDGDVVWRWQEGTSAAEEMRTCEVTADGNVVIAGFTSGAWDTSATIDGWNDVIVAKLDVDTGESIWTYQEGTSDSGGAYVYGAAAKADGSVVLCGRTFGSFASDSSSVEAESSDFLALALDEDGNELWRWQDGPGDGINVFFGAAALEDGSVILAGYTSGSWSGSNLGGYDFAVVKLNDLGSEEWRLQDGTELDDFLSGAAVGIDGSIIISGYTYGSWADTQAGDDLDYDFVAFALDDEGEYQWILQDGTESDDSFEDVVVRPDGRVMLAGFTGGTVVDPEESDDYFDIIAVLLDTNATSADTATLAPSPTTAVVAPTLTPTTAIVAPTPTPTTAVVQATPSPSESSSTAAISTPTPSLMTTTVPSTPSPSESSGATLIEEPTTQPISVPAIPQPVTSGSSDDSETSLVLIIGCSVGAVALVAILGLAIFCFWPKRNRMGENVTAIAGPVPVGGAGNEHGVQAATVASNMPPPPAYDEPPAYSEAVRA